MSCDNHFFWNWTWYLKVYDTHTYLQHSNPLNANRLCKTSAFNM